jgi:hypothetical protein
LRRQSAWEGYLLHESRLPGPRGNLELAQAVAEDGRAADFSRWAALDPTQAPQGTPDEFLTFCGVLGHGRLLAEGRPGALAVLRRAASVPRWRMREAAAMALQRYGETHMPALLEEMET